MASRLLWPRIDDLIYKVLVPAHAKKYMASIQKFLVKEEQQMYVFNLSSLLKLVVLTAVILTLITTTLLPNTRQAESVREMICGGNRDFVYGSHPTIGPIFVTDTTEYDLKNAENMLPGIANLVEDVVFNYDPNEVGVPTPPNLCRPPNPSYQSSHLKLGVPRSRPKKLTGGGRFRDSRSDSVPLGFFRASRLCSASFLALLLFWVF